MNGVSHPSRTALPRGGFTMIELLVVIAIIGVLVAAIVTVGRGVIEGGRSRQTQAMLRVARQAVDQFGSEGKLAAIKQPAGGRGVVRYVDRYGTYPPDELEVFTPRGLPGSTSGGSIAPGGAEFVPAPTPPYPPMTFYSDASGVADPRQFEHRDLVAMLLAIRLYSDTASSILDGIPQRFWSEGLLDVTGQPAQYLDRPGTPVGFGPEDEQVRYLVDAWGLPIAYFAQRDWSPGPNPPPPALSTNHPMWNQASTEMIALNGGAPILMSYGANGAAQLEHQNVDRDFTTVIIGDWMDNKRIDHPLNDDNVYADPTLGATLARGMDRQ